MVGHAWFRVTCVGVFLALLWAGYQLRVQRLRYQFDMTLDARVGERTRIARELHDTLLQSFHGLLLRFQTVSYLLPERPADAKQQLDWRDCITRRRRSRKGAMPCRDYGPPPPKRTISLWRSARWEQNSRPTAAASDRHSTWPSKARRESSIRFFVTRSTRLRRKRFAMPSGTRMPDGSRSRSATTTTQFRLRVRDDGKGIDPAVLASQGLEGHYGLRGMPERAALIGGKLAVWSEAGAGTEVELRLPASIVYATSGRRSWWSRLLPVRRPHSAGGDAS